MTFVYPILGGLTLLIGGFALCVCGQYPVIGAELYSVGSAAAWLGFAVLVIPQVVRMFGAVLPHPTAEHDAGRIIDRLGLRKEYRLGKK